MPAVAAREARATGISFELGLKRCLGRAELYARVLQRFLDTQSKDPQRVRDAVDAGDLGRASMIAHSQISTAGSVGAEGLSEAARALEGVCNAGGGPQLPGVLDAFTSQLATVIVDAHAYLSTRSTH